MTWQQEGGACCVIALSLWFYLGILRSSSPSRFGWRLGGIGIVMGCLSIALLLLCKVLFFSEVLRLPNSDEVLLSTLFVSYIEAGVLEEMSKGVCFLWGYRMLSWQKRNDRVNCLLLGLLVGLGFGLCENIYYTFFMLSNNQFAIIWDRSLASVPAHMIMSAIFAFSWKKWGSFAWSLLAAAFAHGVYDFLAIPGTMLGGMLIDLWLILGICLCLLMGRDSIQRPDKI